MGRVGIVGRKIRHFYLKGLAEERRQDRNAVKNPFGAKDEHGVGKYFAAQERLRKANVLREKRRQQAQKK